LGLIQYFLNLSDEIKKSTEEIDKLNTSIEAIEPPDPTALDSFLNFLEKWGLDCIEVFAFMGKSVAAIFGVILADGAEVVRLLAEEFMSLGSIIWKTLSFDFGGAKKAFGSLGNISETFLKNVEKNYAAYEKTIDEGWAKMLANMSSNTKNTDLTIDNPLNPEGAAAFWAQNKEPVVSGPTAAEIKAAEKKAAAIASLYRSAYSTLDTITQATYDKMLAYYAQDYEANLKLLGDKETAQAIYAQQIDALNDKMYGGTQDPLQIIAQGQGPDDKQYEDYLDEKARAIYEFENSYKQSTMTATGYELEQLQQRFDYFSKYINDKDALNEWLAASQKSILNKNTTDWSDAFSGWATSYSSTLNDMLWESELSFSGIAESFAKMLTQMAIQKSISGLFDADWGSIGSGIMGLFSAQGNVFPANNAGISAYSNQVIDSPIVFPFAKGIGIAGEAGAEAILPLTRMPSNNLGVEAAIVGGSSSSNISVELNITNKSNQAVSAKQDSIKFDAASKKMVVGIILEAAENNTGNFRTTLKRVVQS